MSEEASPFPVIAIDGGAGTGKTTSAALVAERLGFCYLDSGAVYRAIALALRAEGITAAEDPRLPGLVEAMPLAIHPEPGRFRVLLRDRELIGELRRPEISALASQIAVRSEVRRRVRELLRGAARLGPLVVEGRDIGTVVFPEAALKVFLRANLPIRTERRRRDLLRQGIDQPAEEVAADLVDRDRRDSTREDSPLRPAEGALLVDTTACSIEEQVAMILEGYRRALGRAPDDSDTG